MFSARFRAFFFFAETKRSKIREYIVHKHAFWYFSGRHARSDGVILKKTYGHTSYFLKISRFISFHELKLIIHINKLGT